MPVLETHFKNDIPASVTPSAGQPVAPASSNQPSAPGQVDVLLLTFFLLLETTNLTSNTALIRSKQLNQNALDQERVNNDMGQLQSFLVPKRITDVIQDTHMHDNGYFVYYTYTYKYSYPNVEAIEQAQVKNQQISAQREILSDQLNRMQQTAQVAETNVNSISDSAMQSMQEDSYLMQMVQSLTFKALMRQQPQ